MLGVNNLTGGRAVLNGGIVPAGLKAVWGKSGVFGGMWQGGSFFRLFWVGAG